MRKSTRDEYCDKQVQNSQAFRKRLKPKYQKIFRDWTFGGMTTPALGQKYDLSPITIRWHLTRLKRIYNEVKGELYGE